jgi:surface polysaccharide O-acyltransferase-like enzyme
MDQSLSAGIDRLRAISIVGVVCIHATSPLINARAPDPVHDWLFWSLVALNQTARFSVPAFFFLAGLLAARAGSIGARLRRLLLPYVAWSIILWAIPELLRGTARPAAMGVRFLLGQTFTGGYFLVALAQLAIVTPGIVRLASSRPRLAGLAAAALLWAIVGAETIAAYGGDSGPATVLRDGFSDGLSSGIVWAPFFLAGAIAGRRAAALETLLKRSAGRLVILAVVALPLTLVEFRMTFDATRSAGLAATFLKPSCIALAAAISGLALVVPAGPAVTRCMAHLAPAAFAIYLAHGAVIQALQHLLPDPGASIAVAWLEVAVMVIAGVALPLAWHVFAVRRLPAPINLLLFGRSSLGSVSIAAPPGGRTLETHPRAWIADPHGGAPVRGNLRRSS